MTGALSTGVNDGTRAPAGCVCLDREPIGRCHGTLQLWVLKPCRSSPIVLFMQPQRAGRKALAAVIRTAAIGGEMTCLPDALAQARGRPGISKIRRSRFRSQAASSSSLVASGDAKLHGLMGLDARGLERRAGRWTLCVQAMMRTSVNADGRRKIIGFGIRLLQLKSH